MTSPTRASARGGTAAPVRRRDRVATRGRDSVPTHGKDSGPQRGRSAAVERAYARRAQRTGIRHSGIGNGGPDNADSARTPFVILVMVLLGAGLVGTLWLSTAATADSYHLQSARKEARNLTERSESLARQVATLETAPELARRARALGMAPAGDAARLVVRSDGSVVLVGEPRRVTAPAPPPVVAPAPPPAAAPAPPPFPALTAPVTPEAPAASPVPTPAGRT